MSVPDSPAAGRSELEIDSGIVPGGFVDGSPADAARALARRRLADALRRVTTVSVGRPISTESLVAAADVAERLADAVEAAAGPGKAPRIRVRDGQGVFLVTSPMIGPENPVAPPARVWPVEGDGGVPELRGTVKFGFAYEGPPTCVHGGVLAELFDELAGASLVVAGRAGMTGTLTVRYLRPTPIQVDLDLVARPTTIDGRKRGAWVGVYHQGELTAEAHGVFIAVDSVAAAEMLRANIARAGVDVVDPALQAVMDDGGPVLYG